MECGEGSGQWTLSDVLNAVLRCVYKTTTDLSSKRTDEPTNGNHPQAAAGMEQWPMKLLLLAAHISWYCCRLYRLTASSPSSSQHAPHIVFRALT